MTDCADMLTDPIPSTYEGKNAEKDGRCNRVCSFLR